MVLTLDVKLPTEEELCVQEVNLSGSTLRAGSFHLGKYCEAQNNEFMLCRQELDDPRKCINEGKAVTSCTLEFFRNVKKSCLDEFNQFANCLDKSSGDFAFEFCRNTQAVFDKCMVDEMRLHRPEYGYFTRARIHDTKRPKPPAENIPHYEDATPRLPDDAPRKPARFGSRFYWITE